MIRRPPRSTRVRSSAASDVYKRQVADYLVRKGIAFRDAHEIVGKTVRYCIENGTDIPELSLAQWQLFSPRIEDDIFASITLEASVNARRATGGTALERVK